MTEATRRFPAVVSVLLAVVYDESEGVIAWYVGFDGPGCVTMERAGKTVILSIAHCPKLAG